MNRGKYYLLLILMLLPLVGCNSSTTTITANNGAVASSPTSIVVSAGYQNANIQWLPVAGASSYNVYFSQTPGLPLSARALFTNAFSPLVVPNLTNNVTYYFSITSVNAAGESAPSVEQSATPNNAPVPFALTNVKVVAGNGQVTVSWKPHDQTSIYTIYYDTQPSIDTTKAKSVAVAVPDQNNQNVTQGVVTGLANNTTY